MNVLVDVHHHDLFRSLYFLFRNRLKFNFYVPYGIEWNRKYKINQYPNEITINQYLVSCKNWININKDISDVNFLKLEEFGDINIDIIVSSLFTNIIPFLNLTKDYDKKRTKHIIQCGNNFHPSLIDAIGKNLLSSSMVVYQLSKISNKVFYHQEFDLTKFCPPKSNYNPCSVYSFQHGFGTGKHPFLNDYNLFINLKEKLNNFDFRCYGHGGEYRSVFNIWDFIRESGFIFHVKPQGDGYGHICHNSMACGKPIIYKSEYLIRYGIKMTCMLLFDDEVSVDMSHSSVDNIVKKIKYMSEDYDQVSKKVYDKFKNVVDFDAEFVKINKFVENLL